MIPEVSIPSLEASLRTFRIISGQDFSQDCKHPAERVRQIAGIVNVPERKE
jgi:hypothetical protein